MWKFARTRKCCRTACTSGCFRCFFIKYIYYILIHFNILTLYQTSSIAAFLGGLSSARFTNSSLDKGNDEEEDEDTGCFKTYSKDVKCYGEVLAMLLEMCPNSNKIPQVCIR